MWKDTDQNMQHVRCCKWQIFWTEFSGLFGFCLVGGGGVCFVVLFGFVVLFAWVFLGATYVQFSTNKELLCSLLRGCLEPCPQSLQSRDCQRKDQASNVKSAKTYKYTLDLNWITRCLSSSSILSSNATGTHCSSYAHRSVFWTRA